MTFAPWAAASRAYFSCFSIIDSLPVLRLEQRRAHNSRHQGPPARSFRPCGRHRFQGRPIQYTGVIDRRPSGLAPPMNLLDALVLILLALGLIAGARAGLLGPVLGLAGALGGFALVLVAASLLHEQLLEVRQPGVRSSRSSASSRSSRSARRSARRPGR